MHEQRALDYASDVFPIEREIIRGTWMTQPEIEVSPKSRVMKAMTDPAAVTTKTWAMMLEHFVNSEI